MEPAQSSVVVRTCSMVVSALIRGCIRIVQGIAFWSAVVLPALHIPLLFVGSPQVVTGSVIGYLILLNVVTAVVGHGYRSETPRDELSRDDAD